MKITIKLAKRVAENFKINLKVIPLEYLKKGLQIELEHGKNYPNKKYAGMTNITDGDIGLTGGIVVAHLLEFPDYYQRLEELEKEAKKYWRDKKKPSIFLK